MIKDASIKCTGICLKMYVLNKHISSSDQGFHPTSVGCHGERLMPATVVAPWHGLHPEASCPKACCNTLNLGV
jgi:hypothetical protein